MPEAVIVSTARSPIGRAFKGSLKNIRPDELFSRDQFHPSGAGYEFAAGVLLPALCSAAGVFTSVALTA